MSKYAKALGIMEIDVGEVKIEMKPTFKHKRKFRKLILDPALNKDKNALFDQFSNLFTEWVAEFDPDNYNENDVREYVETYIMDLFNEVLIAFKYSTREKIAEAERTALNSLKKTLADD